MRPPKNAKTPGKTTKGDRGDDISYLKVLERIKALLIGLDGSSPGVTHASTSPLRPPRPSNGTSPFVFVGQIGGRKGFELRPLRDVGDRTKNEK